MYTQAVTQRYSLPVSGTESRTRLVVRTGHDVTPVLPVEKYYRMRRQ
jgi:hypothetical protein